MFTIPAIHHSATRLEDGSMAALHLNALNGSSNVLSSNGSTSGYSSNSCAYGGLFGVSVSENHPYRPEDSGSTFHQKSEANQKSVSPFWSNVSSLSTPSASLDQPNVLTESPHARLHTTLTTNARSKTSITSTNLETVSSADFRRLSLDLDNAPTNGCCHLDDRSLSLEDIKRDLNPRCVKEIINEKELPDDLNITGLSITEVNFSTFDVDEASGGERSKQPTRGMAKLTNRHKRRALTTDAETSGRALRLLEKIKDSKREQNGSSSKHGKQGNQEVQSSSHDRRVSSKGSRHNISRHLSDSATQPQERERGKQKEKKLLSRSSLD